MCPNIVVPMVLVQSVWQGMVALMTSSHPVLFQRAEPCARAAQDLALSRLSAAVEEVGRRTPKPWDFLESQHDPGHNHWVGKRVLQWGHGAMQLFGHVTNLAAHKQQQDKLLPNLCPTLCLYIYIYICVCVYILQYYTKYIYIYRVLVSLFNAQNRKWESAKKDLLKYIYIYKWHILCICCSLCQIHLDNRTVPSLRKRYHFRAGGATCNQLQSNQMSNLDPFSRPLNKTSGFPC